MLCIMAAQGTQAKDWWAVTALSVDNEGAPVTDYSDIEEIHIKFRIKELIIGIEKNLKRVYNQYKD